MQRRSKLKNTKKRTQNVVGSHQGLSTWVTGGLHPVEGVCIKATPRGVNISYPGNGRSSELGRGTTPHHSPPPRRLQRFDIAAFGVSIASDPRPPTRFSSANSYTRLNNSFLDPSRLEPTFEHISPLSTQQPGKLAANIFTSFFTAFCSRAIVTVRPTEMRRQ